MEQLIIETIEEESPVATVFNDSEELFPTREDPVQHTPSTQQF